jgi:hypothetical protein
MIELYTKFAHPERVGQRPQLEPKAEARPGLPARVLRCCCRADPSRGAVQQPALPRMRLGRTLVEELARRNVVSKVRSFAGGRTKAGGSYRMGALAHFLKNRFYIGEVVVCWPAPSMDLDANSRVTRPPIPTKAATLLIG